MLEQRFEVRGTSFDFLDPDASMLRDALPGCSYESSVCLLLERALAPESSVFFDVGALYGFFSVWAARRGASVVSFEPNEHYVEILRHNLRRNRCSDVRVETLALSDGTGTLAFAARALLHHADRQRRSYVRGVVNHLKRRHPDECVECLTAHPTEWRAGVGPWLAANLSERLGLFDGGTDATARYVDADTLDRWCDRTGISPTVVKIDVHGSELPLVRGMRTTLATTVRDLVIEVHTDDLRVDGSLEDLVAELEAAGMDIFEICGFRRDVAHLVPLRGAARAAFVDQRRWTTEELYFMRCLYARRGQC
ncbi:MAG TPA: FkbM family methyltransferase [Conexibacter sp.]|nr:FkbM family methyltransferase [Conexibacter sp.]